MTRKMLFTIFKYLFSFQRYSSFKTCKLGKWWHHTLNQTLFKYDGKRYFSQFVSEMFDSLQYDSTNCAPQYELKSSVTMATYWVPVLPILKAFLATFDIPFWYLLTALHIHDPASIYVSSSLWPHLTFFKLKITNILKSTEWGLEKSELPWKQNFL